jgi:nucleoid-associated protein YgaU
MGRTPGARHIREESPWAALGIPLLGLGLALCGTVLIRSADGPAAARSDAGALLGLSAAVLGCAVVLAWCLTAVLALLAVLARQHGRERLAAACGRCSPAVLRRVAATVLGVQLLAAPSAAADEEISPFWASTDTAGAPAAVAPAPSPGPGTEREQDPPAAPPETGPSSGVVPSAAGPEATPAAAAPPGGAAAPEARPPCPAPAERTVDGAVTVMRGDTLWSLAASRLGPGATDAQIARAWPAWYELNRHVLVDGPHLLLPGQRLLVPTPAGG